MNDRRFFFWPTWKGSGWFKPDYSSGKRKVYWGICSMGTGYQFRINLRRRHWYIVAKGTIVERLIGGRL